MPSKRNYPFTQDRFARVLGGADTCFFIRGRASTEWVASKGVTADFRTFQ